MIRLALLALACLAVPCSYAAPAPARPPVEAFFSEPDFGSAHISPTGKYVLFTTSVKGQRTALIVFDVEARSLARVAQFTDADIGHFSWVDDERIVFDAYDKGLVPGEITLGSGLYAVNRDASGFRQLAARSGMPNDETGTSIRSKILPWHTFMMDNPGAHDSKSVYVRSPHYTDYGPPEYVSLLHLDTLTGHATPVERPGKVQHWLLDHKGMPRLAVAQEDKITNIHYLDPDTKAWRIIASYDPFGDGLGGFEPLAFGPDGKLYVSAAVGSDKMAVHVFDLKQNRIVREPMLKVDGYDFSGEMIVDAKRLLGARFTNDATTTAWFDSAMQQVQKEVDALLPATNNLISVGVRSETGNYLVRAYSDLQPSVYMVYIAKDKALLRLGQERPQINPAHMGEQDPVRYKARDGLSIPALMTYPRGAPHSKLPLVVLVHGGPHVRGSVWGWDAESQFLASRGYAVMEPSFRGTTGYGGQFFRAGWKQWGKAMQDDLADAVQWAVAQGIVDPKRVCIAGASYGGYATLMGLAKHGDLFKCGVNWAGVTDLNLLFTGHWSIQSDMSDIALKYGFPVLVGDPVKDAADLKANSPIELAAQIRQPVLMAYGTEDRRVPLVHGRRFLDAVKPSNAGVEWIQYQGEGHGWTNPANRIDFWNRVEKFLATQLGAPLP